MFDRTTLKEAVTDQIDRLPLTILAGLTGGVLFTWVQTITGTNDIAKFLGDSIVAQGGYATRFAPPIGWTVHLTIALSYAFLFSAAYSLFLRTGSGLTRSVKVFTAALTIGVVATWIANPAISLTIPLLAGTVPETIAPIYFKLGTPLWNHLIFFTYSAVVAGYAADALIACRNRLQAEPSRKTNDAP